MKQWLTICISLCLSACSHPEPKNVIRVGTIAGPETDLMQVVKQVALKRYHLIVKIDTFNDYILPNQALHDGEIDANAFQHLPYLEAQNKARGYHLVAAGKTFLYPMALYSQKIKSLTQLKTADKIAIPNDPSNEARALLLLQRAKLISLKNKATEATVNDIDSNPKKLQFITLDAAGLPRTLQDVTVAVINTTFAKPAGLNPQQGLIVENTDSPYTNIIATTPALLHSKKLRELVQAYQSPAVLLKAKSLFGHMAIAGFKVKHQHEASAVNHSQ